MNNKTWEIKNTLEGITRRLDEIEESQLSDIEFKDMVIKKFKKPSANYQKL